MNSRKRSRQAFPDDLQANKRVCGSHSDSSEASTQITSTEQALNYVRSLFPTHAFQDRILPIAWKHQLYALLTNRTDVDRKLRQLNDEGKIRFFKLGTTLGANEIAIVDMNDYSAFLRKNFDNKITEKFIAFVSSCGEMNLTKELLSSFSDDDIKELIQNGLLASHRIAGNWLLSIPNAGLFVKNFVQSRKSLLRIITATKFNEILRSELESKKHPKGVKLGMQYHILDLIGSDSVQCISSPTGTILRLC